MNHRNTKIIYIAIIASILCIISKILFYLNFPNTSDYTGSLYYSITYNIFYVVFYICFGRYLHALGLNLAKKITYIYIGTFIIGTVLSEIMSFLAYSPNSIGVIYVKFILDSILFFIQILILLVLGIILSVGSKVGIVGIKIAGIGCMMHCIFIIFAWISLIFNFVTINYVLKVTAYIIPQLCILYFLIRSNKFIKTAK